MFPNGSTARVKLNSILWSTQIITLSIAIPYVSAAPFLQKRLEKSHRLLRTKECDDAELSFAPSLVRCPAPENPIGESGVPKDHGNYKYCADQHKLLARIR